MDCEKILLCQIFKDRSILYNLTIDESYFINRNSKLFFNALQQCDRLTLEFIPGNLQDVEPALPGALIAEIMSAYPSAKNWQHFEEKLIKAKKSIEVNKMINRIKDMNINDPDEIVGYLEKSLVNISKGMKGKEVLTLEDIMPNYIDRIQERVKRGGEMPGIKSPWSELNSVTLGFQKNLLYVIGARPSQGKTACILNILTEMVMDNKSVGFISAESNSIDMQDRIFSSYGNINLTRLKSGMLGNTDQNNFGLFADRMKDKKYCVCDISNIKLSKLISVTRRMKVVNKVDAIFIDYLQKIKNDNSTIPMNQQIAEISTELKNIARRLEIPIITAAQVNREGDKEPRIKDLLWSGQIEQDADLIMLIHGSDEDFSFTVEKNRDGPLIKMGMHFRKEIVRFFEKNK